MYKATEQEQFCFWLMTSQSIPLEVGWELNQTRGPTSWIWWDNWNLSGQMLIIKKSIDFTIVSYVTKCLHVSCLQSNSSSGFKFLIYFLSLLSQCVDCIIMAVTESHTVTINDSARSNRGSRCCLCSVRLSITTTSPAIDKSLSWLLQNAVHFISIMNM